jgi:hypothetical protein
MGQVGDVICVLIRDKSKVHYMVRPTNNDSVDKCYQMMGEKYMSSIFPTAQRCLVYYRLP